MHAVREDAVGRRAWEKAAERIKITDAALEAAEEWLQESAPVEFAAFQAADAEMRAAALRATVEALRASAPAEFAALEGLDAALERLQAAAPVEFAAWDQARRAVE